MKGMLLGIAIILFGIAVSISTIPLFGLIVNGFGLAFSIAGYIEKK